MDDMRHKVWWGINIFFAAVFVSGAMLIMLRQVDGAGHVETFGSRMAALGVLGAFALLIVVIEALVWFFSRPRKER
ncbi:hypothetical protein FD09_GL002120 [Schleiferilactobacillus perolens DSM 12744]|jgi:hypothetical protein|uniref:DUF3923 domain-containing protein n=2 Tax=Schleiferilactobacillus perolens TaxID=100468 RepID=A0A0R1MYT3_9LACO|nr:hypothetical protein FD09_GL002120 [Schleiferilactobacillus perolens DSM 12744]